MLVANWCSAPSLTVLSFVVNLSLNCFYLLLGFCLIFNVACLHPLIVSVPASVRLVNLISILQVRFVAFFDVSKVGEVKVFAALFIGIIAIF